MHKDRKHMESTIHHIYNQPDSQTLAHTLDMGHSNTKRIAHSGAHKWLLQACWFLKLEPLASLMSKLEKPAFLALADKSLKHDLTSFLLHGSSQTRWVGFTLAGLLAHASCHHLQPTALKIFEERAFEDDGHWTKTRLTLFTT